MGVEGEETPPITRKLYCKSNCPAVIVLLALEPLKRRLLFLNSK